MALFVPVGTVEYVIWSGPLVGFPRLDRRRGGGGVVRERAVVFQVALLAGRERAVGGLGEPGVDGVDQRLLVDRLQAARSAPRGTATAAG